MKQDDITLSLSSGINTFLDFLKSDLPKKILELDANVQSDNYYKELNRISNSLEQYTKKEVGLFYVGFLGSYSSGKTSTINSLLEIWDTPNSRKVSNNPTDDCITLLTNQSNVQNVFNFSKEGAISIRTNTIFNIPFLNNIVLMDTPGSGDPNIIEAIVRDSLPLCDIIIYTLNATAPFTDIDKPFLLAQQEKLKNIPLFFVLTRADEFKKDKNVNISKDNFDDIKYQEELQILINRINESIKSDFSRNDIVVIDNINQFNVEELKDKISILTKGCQENLLTLHNHKLSYFKSEIKIIHGYFEKLAELKIEKCEKFIDKAKDNIENFDKQVEISKVKFNSLWSDYNQKFQNIYNGSITSYIDTNLSDKLKNFETGNDLPFRENHIERIKTESITESINIFRIIEDKTNKESINLLEICDEMIDYEKLTLKNEYPPVILTESISLSKPIQVETYINEFLYSFNSRIRTNLDLLKGIFEQIKKTIQAKKPLDKVQENIQKYKESSTEILDLYYSAVKMYNVVAFSYEVKSYISELGLAKDFDLLESSDTNRLKYNNIAEKALLVNYDTYTQNFENEIDDLIKKSDSIDSHISNIQIPQKDHFDLSDIIVTKNNQTFDFQLTDIISFLTDSYSELSLNLQKRLSALKNDIRQLKNKRRNRYFYVFVGTSIILLIAYLALKLNKIELPNSILVNIGIGVFSSALVTVCSAFFDRYNLKKEKTIKEVKENLKTENREIVTNLFKSFKEKNEKKKKDLESSLISKWNDYEQKLFNELFVNTYEKTNTELTNYKEELKNLIEAYKESYTSFHNSILKLFNQQDILSESIKSIALKIKEDSIKPSFELLTNTLEEIKTVKNEISSIDI